MLLGLITSVFVGCVCGEGIEPPNSRPVVLPMPLEMPNRNDRAQQCWLRIEDVELTETMSIYCTIAQKFLSFYIHDYNNKKMMDDDVEVSLWIEKPSGGNDAAYGAPIENGIKDWRVTTIMDPITKYRIYVSKNADCRVLMYTRDSISNYKVDCATILYFVNEHSGSATFKIPRLMYVISIIVFLVTNVM